MSINLLEAIQHNLGYPSLQKIDPNTQHVKNDTADRFSQAAIPAILTGFYKYVQPDNGATNFLNGGDAESWIDKIFGANKEEVVQHITAYAPGTSGDAIAQMEAIANETVKLVKEKLPANAGIKDVKHFFNTQRNVILMYLPAELNMGQLLNDTTLDDKTHKMEGPVSSFMHNLANAFTNQVSDEEISKKSV